MITSYLISRHFPIYNGGYARKNNERSKRWFTYFRGKAQWFLTVEKYLNFIAFETYKCFQIFSCCMVLNFNLFEFLKTVKNLTFSNLMMSLFLLLNPIQIVKITVFCILLQLFTYLINVKLKFLFVSCVLIVIYVLHRAKYWKHYFFLTHENWDDKKIERWWQLPITMIKTIHMRCYRNSICMEQKGSYACTLENGFSLGGCLKNFLVHLACHEMILWCLKVHVLMYS